MCRTCVFQPVPAGVLVFRVPALVAAVGGAGAAGAAAIAAAGQQLQQSDVFTACCVRLIARVQCIYKPTAELIRAINTRCRRCHATGVQIMHTSANSEQQKSNSSRVRNLKRLAFTACCCRFLLLAHQTAVVVRALWLVVLGIFHQCF